MFANAFYCSIALYHFFAEFCNGSAAARASADSGIDQWLAKAVVKRIDQQPRTAIRHAEIFRGGRDGTAIGDRFEQRDFAGTDGDVVTVVDAYAKPEIGRRFHRREECACKALIVTHPKVAARGHALVHVSQSRLRTPTPMLRASMHP